MKLIKIINPENASEEEVKSYMMREASRAVLVDDEDKIALLHISKEDYYKLPGGGIEEGEDKISTLKRECKEETGCNIEIIDEIGSIIEYMKIFNIRQTSYCYLVRVKGPKGEPDFTEEERSKGFKVLWFPYEEAVQKLKESEFLFGENNSYIVPRDLAFIEEAKNKF